MGKTVIFIKDTLDENSWEEIQVESVLGFLKSKFDYFPSSGRIYHNFVSVVHDVTPCNEDGIKKLESLEGKFYVVIYPEGPDAPLWVAVVLLAAAIVMMPKVPPVPTIRNVQTPSPNNGLGNRVNSVRINGRIPDIYGQVRSVPDLIANSYRIFENNIEKEYSFMCIGRGYYEISDVKDDTTPIDQIEDASVEIYDPFTSPNSGDDPQFRIGDPIGEPVYYVKRENSVNGQTLQAPNHSFFSTSGQGSGAYAIFKYPNEINISSDDAFVNAVLDLRDTFFPDDTVTISNATGNTNGVSSSVSVKPLIGGKFQFSIPSSSLPDGYSAGAELILSNAIFTIKEDGFVTDSLDLNGEYVIESVALITEAGPLYYCEVTLIDPELIAIAWNSVISGMSYQSIMIKRVNYSLGYNFSGDYTISDVSEKQIKLINPESVNADWLLLSPDKSSERLYPDFQVSTIPWIGPFNISSECQYLWFNFQAINGLYADNGEETFPFPISLDIEITNLTSGSVQTVSVTVPGSNTSGIFIGHTEKVVLDNTGFCSVRIIRTTERNLTFAGTIVDELKWKDLLSVSDVEQEHFGNVTTVQSVTLTNSGALNIKERKLNALVTRKLPRRIIGDVFTDELFATKNAADIISAIALDQYIGNRQKSEIDFDSIFDTISEINSYFGTEKLSEFSYTFDSDNLSFEEIVFIITNAIGCIAYRIGSQTKLSFEKETDDSVLLFNHRNKIPNSESRQINFGNFQDNDGLEFEYVDSSDDSIQTLYFPSDQSAVNPKKIESIGIRNKLQAMIIASRIYNKMLYQNVHLEFTGTAETNILNINDRILVTDGTRSNSGLEGEVISQNGFELTLSQSWEALPTNPYIHLQLYDGTVENIAIRAGSTNKKVILQKPPRLPLILDSCNYAKTGYLIVGTESRPQAFLVSEKSTENNFSVSIKAINYDSRYYQNDSDYLNGILDIDGNAI